MNKRAHFTAFAIAPEKISANLHSVARDIALEMSGTSPEFSLYHYIGLSTRTKTSKILTCGKTVWSIASSDSPALRFKGVSFISCGFDNDRGFVVFVWTFNNFFVFASTSNSYSTEKVAYNVFSIAQNLVSTNSLPKKFASLSKRMTALDGSSLPEPEDQSPELTYARVEQVESTFANFSTALREEGVRLSVNPSSWDSESPIEEEDEDEDGDNDW